MTKVVVDQATQAALAGVEKQVAIRDAAGRTLGFFTPLSEFTVSQSSRLSDTKLRKREQETERFSTAEVLARLKELP